jgi:formylglycine-generating enzyme required for sulfatase activity
MARIFISYSRSDRLFLDNFLPLIRKVYGNDSLWYDDDIHGGADWWQMILSEVGQCDLFIYLISNESLGSPYCQAELREALRLHKQILPVIVRRLSPAYPGNITDDLKPILQRTQYVDLSGGFKDANMIAGLYAAINRLLARVPAQAQPPQTPDPIPQPPVPDKTNAKGRWVIIAVSLGLVGVVALVLIWQGGRSSDGQTTLSPSPTTQVALQSTTEAPAETPPPSQTPSSTPDFAALAMTFDAQQAAAAQTAQTATAQAQTTFDAAASVTQSAAETATATLWTPTLTPNVTASFEAFLTERAILTGTAIAESWTATPTPAALDLARNFSGGNRDWQPFAAVFEDDPAGVEMMLVPVGEFTMGSEDGADDEKPSHPQIFDVPFWIDRTEVTRAMYAQCVAAGECTTTPENDYSTRDTQPINRVTWFQARDYCAWRGARLPTEAEWEYAARGPDNWGYPWGNEFVAENVVYGSNSGNVTADVGSKANGASWVGALDMSGNVWEWVSSLYLDYSYDSSHESNEDDNRTRVLRGGSFNDYVPSLRAAYRNDWDPDFVSDFIGFRCARS